MGKHEGWRIVKFFLFSVSAGVIELGVFTVLNELTTFSYWPCYLIALILSVLWNFTLNRKYTFRSANHVKIAMAKVALFYCVFTPVSTLLGDYLADGLLLNAYLVTLLCMAMNLTTEYLYDRFFVFRHSIDSVKESSK